MKDIQHYVNQVMDLASECEDETDYSPKFIIAHPEWVDIIKRLSNKYSYQHAFTFCGLKIFESKYIDVNNPSVFGNLDGVNDFLFLMKRDGTEKT